MTPCDTIPKAKVHMQKEALTKIAGFVAHHKIEVPVVFLLELHKPVSFLIHTAIAASSPLFTALGSSKSCNLLSELFESRENIESLISLIEAREGAK